MRRNQMTWAAAVAVLSLGTVASAQTLRLETVAVRPGASATVRVFLQSPVNVAAVNFTVRANSADVPAAITGVKGSAPAIAGANYLFVGNNANIVGGGTREFRGVLYSSTTGQSFAAATEVHIATLTVPTASSAAPDLTITLTAPNTFSDGITALVGVSDAQGRSIAGGAPITAGSNTRPTTVNGAIRIDPVIVNTPFTGTDTIRSGWRFSQLIPDPAVSTRMVAANNTSTGVNFTQQNTFDNSFSIYDMADSGSEFLNPTADSVVVYSWEATSNRTEGNDLPSLRLRTGARDFSWTQMSVLGEFARGAGAQPFVLPTGNLNDAPKVMRAATYAPISVNNNVGTNGMLMAMDLLTYGTGSAGGVLAVRNFSAYSRPVTALTGQQNHFSAAFTPGNAQGFALTINGIVDPSLDDESNNVYRATTSTDGGILIAPNSNTVTPNPALPGTFFIAFATFERTLTAAELPINGNRLYRLQFTARTTVPNAQLAPTVRVRFNAGPVVPGTTIPQADFTQEIVLESVGGETAMHLPTGPTARTYTSFFAIPTELSGGISKISLDAYPSGIPGDFAPGGVVFEAVNVASFDFPLP